MSDLANIEHLEADLWDAADNLRANSKLTAGRADAYQDERRRLR